MADIQDLVRISGYSRSTVFRYLSGKQVRPAAEEAIRLAIHESGYQIQSAKAAPQKDIQLQISAPAAFRGFKGYADIVQGIMHRASEYSIPVSFSTAQNTGTPDAVIILGKNKEDEDHELQSLQKQHIPCILVNRMIDSADCSWVSVDFYTLTKHALERLSACACKRTGMYIQANLHRAEQQKKLAFINESRSLGLEPLLIEGSVEESEQQINALLRSDTRPDSWLAPNDQEAMRLIRLAIKAGLRIPEDISVIGMNDVEEASYMVPALTSIHIPFRACGASAVDAALHLIQNPLEQSIKILVQHRLIDRESCRALIDT